MSVLVFVENWDGKFKKLSFELISYATRLAEMLNTKSVALSLGNVDSSELEKLGKYGASKILNVHNEKLNILDNQVYTSIIADMAKKEEATIIVIANNNTGKAIAPRLSVKLKAGIGSGVSKLPLSTSPFVVYKKVFSGNAYADVVLKSDIKILTLSQNSFDITETNNSPVIEN
ncbi:MAG: electron transfer flavoprotein subunit alpha/FixB family protein, partial [Syntrophothermus sp.]